MLVGRMDGRDRQVLHSCRQFVPWGLWFSPINERNPKNHGKKKGIKIKYAEMEREVEETGRVQARETQYQIRMLKTIERKLDEVKSVWP